jgi:hypothetical protein
MVTSGGTGAIRDIGMREIVLQLFETANFGFFIRLEIMQGAVSTRRISF